MKYTIVLKREHFPEDLDSASIKDAYWSHDMCIMDKAIESAAPHLHEGEGCICVLLEEKISTIKEISLLHNRHDGPLTVGKILKLWNSSAAQDIADKMAKDPAYTEEFEIEIFD